jgi:anti-sigma B factor antagonist
MTRVISPVGRIDGATSPAMESEITEVIAGGERHLLIDLSKVDYMSSAGLRVLLAAMKKVKALQGDMVLCCMQPFVKEVFDLTGFSRIFSIYASEEEALRQHQG